MHLSKSSLFLIIALGISSLAVIPDEVRAQYNCAVTIDWKGKTVLQGQIRDTERPPTAELWKLLKTLSFSPTKNGQGLPNPKSTGQTTLKESLRVKVNGAGEVQLQELHLVRNPLNDEAWTIAPVDVERILKLRNASGTENPKK